ncbi:hypothetical protein FQA39_LY17627 [Lamprigera yunnana]|nr:hypothetical protein FQA39_LY17627 [Lamprigera yunnana]
MKYYVLCTVLFFFYLRNVNSLKCYTCVSTASNQTCAQFNKTKIPLLTCNKTTTNVSQFLNTSRLNYNYLNDVNRATDYECVVYKKYYLEEKFFQVGRGCFPKTSYVNSCQALY